MRTKAQREAVAMTVVGLLCLAPTLWVMWDFIDITMTHALTTTDGYVSGYEAIPSIARLGATTTIVVGCLAVAFAILTAHGLSILHERRQDSRMDRETVKKMSPVALASVAALTGCMGGISAIKYLGIQDIFTAWMVGFWPTVAVSILAFAGLTVFWTASVTLARLVAGPSTITT